MTALIKGIAMFKTLSVIATVGTLAVTLGTVRLTHGAVADGKPLPAGTYQVQLSEEMPKPAVGQTADSERWVEFVQGGKVIGREVASVISDAEIASHVKGPRPRANSVRVDTLKGGDYLRVWINKGGNNYLINLRNGR